MRICIDFDHVLVETSKAILKTYNDEFNDNIFVLFIIAFI